MLHRTRSKTLSQKLGTLEWILQQNMLWNTLSRLETTEHDKEHSFNEGAGSTEGNEKERTCEEDENKSFSAECFAVWQKIKFSR